MSSNVCSLDDERCRHCYNQVISLSGGGKQESRPRGKGVPKVLLDTITLTSTVSNSPGEAVHRLPNFCPMTLPRMAAESTKRAGRS